MNRRNETYLYIKDTFSPNHSASESTASFVCPIAMCADFSLTTRWEPSQKKNYSLWCKSRRFLFPSTPPRQMSTTKQGLLCRPLKR
ncbi:hypothetical protein CDAR_202221 [Caerostris darwini]|uniref:Uncharacterized protein n=1 Tax=Caerostris darwini TaxID=1538125 RepID=A0AAV4SUM2_9ARAC|nr:hypothetical protein CDAR_202221 [Caerostris darwini]